MYKDKVRQREYVRDWTAHRRQEYFQNKSCAKCGVENNLQLDHVDPDQKISHSIWSWSAVRREAELLKCQVLCSDCHKEKTKRDKGRHYLEYVDEITSKYATGKFSMRDLAIQYGISASTVCTLVGEALHT